MLGGMATGYGLGQAFTPYAPTYAQTQYANEYYNGQMPRAFMHHPNYE